jgi:hypothetical protein
VRGRWQGAFIADHLTTQIEDNVLSGDQGKRYRTSPPLLHIRNGWRGDKPHKGFCALLGAACRRPEHATTKPTISKAATRMKAAAPFSPVSDHLTETANFGPNPGALRMFSHLPTALPDQCPLLVVLHGCTQSSAGYDLGAVFIKAARGGLPMPDNLSLDQLNVMSAIERCRTAALGGHVARCEDCTHTLITYNSCRNRAAPHIICIARLLL